MTYDMILIHSYNCWVMLRSISTYHVDKPKVSVRNYNDVVNYNVHANNDDIVITLIVLGIQVANIGEWIRHKWNISRGYLKSVP